jgi:hypothetical protein
MSTAMTEITENSRIRELELRVSNLSKLVEINNIINSTLDIRRLLTIIMENIKDTMTSEAPRCFFSRRPPANLFSRWPWAERAMC